MTKETFILSKPTLKQCRELFKKKEELIELIVMKRREVKEKQSELYDLSHKKEETIKEIDIKLPKFLSSLQPK